MLTKNGCGGGGCLNPGGGCERRGGGDGFKGPEANYPWVKHIGYEVVFAVVEVLKVQVSLILAVFLLAGSSIADQAKISTGQVPSVRRRIRNKEDEGNRHVSSNLAAHGLLFVGDICTSSFFSLISRYLDESCFKCHQKREDFSGMELFSSELELQCIKWTSINKTHMLDLEEGHLNFLFFPKNV
ncbi:hypothetical protein Tco_0024697 [Tanacetum coccineum]